MASVFAFAGAEGASAQSLNGKIIIVDPTCEMAPSLCRPHAGPGPAGGAGSQAAGPASNDILKRWYRPFR
jgi:hypothetical protein